MLDRYRSFRTTDDRLVVEQTALTVWWNRFCILYFLVFTFIYFGPLISMLWSEWTRTGELSFFLVAFIGISVATEVWILRSNIKWHMSWHATRFVFDRANDLVSMNGVPLGKLRDLERVEIAGTRIRGIGHALLHPFDRFYGLQYLWFAMSNGSQMPIDYGAIFTRYIEQVATEIADYAGVEVVSVKPPVFGM